LSRVQHTSKVEGDGAGYDIKSFTAQGEVKYIEVKTTRSGPGRTFFMSQNEVAFSRLHPHDFYIYRVYGYDEANQGAKFYIVQGDVESAFELTPTEYRVALSGDY
jgi:hypothetical protein